MSVEIEKWKSWELENGTLHPCHTKFTDHVQIIQHTDLTNLISAYLLHRHWHNNSTKTKTQDIIMNNTVIWLINGLKNAKRCCQIHKSERNFCLGTVKLLLLL